MAENSSASGIVNRQQKQTETVHPHYFSSFQNYCCGPKSKSTSTPSNKEPLPIPDGFKSAAEEIVLRINQYCLENLFEIARYSSILPSKVFESEFSPDYLRYLVDRGMLRIMTDAGVINWMPSLRPLYPVRTSGNGNCLLHAALIAMVGIHDFNLCLRDQLAQFMKGNNDILKTSWKNERIKSDKNYGIQYEDAKLEIEWKELCDLVRYDNSEDGQAAPNLQYLEGVHIFSISNMFRRPIIVLSEDVVRNKFGDPIAYNDLYGIYLPILEHPNECCRIPLVLAYDQSHFSPLQANGISTGAKQDHFLPLYQSKIHAKTGEHLPIRFLGSEVDEQKYFDLLNKYLNIRELSYFPNTGGSACPVTCAELAGCKTLTNKNDFYALYVEYLADFFELQKKKLRDEEERRRYDTDYYSSTLPSYDTVTGSYASPNHQSTPPSYAAAVTKRNDIVPTTSLERRPSYSRAVDNNSSTFISNQDTRDDRPYPQQPPPRQQSSVNIKLNKPTVQNNDKPTGFESNWDSNEYGSSSNSKNVDRNPIAQRGIDSRLKQESPRGAVQIPVNYMQSGYPSNNLIDFDQSLDHIRQCLSCHQFFSRLSDDLLCTECNRNKTYYSPRSTTTPRVLLTNHYPGYKNSDFINSTVTLPRLKGSQKLQCYYCGEMNIITNDRYASERICSVCRRQLR